MAGKTAVVLGGGIGGLVAARELRRRLDSGDRVVLVDRTARHLFAPSLLWVMEGSRRPQAIVRDLGRLSRHGIEIVKADVTVIDPNRRVVETSTGPVSYDALVVALGAQLAPEDMPGFSDAAHTPWDLEGAQKTRDAVQRFEGGRAVVMVSSLPYKCPAAPYETALLLDHAFRQRGVRGQIEIEILTPELQPMPVAGPEVGQAVTELLRSRGISYRPGAKPVAIDPGGKSVRTEGGEDVPFDLLVGVPPHRPPAAARTSGLANEAGWLPVDRHTMAAKGEGVYAIGDVAAIALPSGMPLPKAGVFAERQAKAVARSIAADFGKGARSSFDGTGSCFIEMGGGVAGYASGAFYAEPKPAVALRDPGRRWHLLKVAFEKWWMWRWTR